MSRNLVGNYLDISVKLSIIPVRLVRVKHYINFHLLLYSLYAILGPHFQLPVTYFNPHQAMITADLTQQIKSKAKRRNM